MICDLLFDLAVQGSENEQQSGHFNILILKISSFNAAIGRACVKRPPQRKQQVIPTDSLLLWLK